MAKIFVGIISRSKPELDTTSSLQNASAYAQQFGHQVGVMTHKGDSLLCRGRQEILYQFKQSDYDYLFTVDDDIDLPSDCLIKLLSAEKDYIGGFYALKGNKNVKTAIRKLDSLNLHSGVKNYRGSEILTPELQQNPIVEVQYISGGCALINRELVELLWDAYDDETHTYIKNNDGFTERRALYMPFVYNKEYLSEDWAICRRISNINKKIYAHAGVLCGHIGPYTWRIK